MQQSPLILTEALIASPISAFTCKQLERLDSLFLVNGNALVGDYFCEDTLVEAFASIFCVDEDASLPDNLIASTMMRKIAGRTLRSYGIQVSAKNGWRKNKRAEYVDNDPTTVFLANLFTELWDRRA